MDREVFINVAWRLTENPDTLPYSGQVGAWMERFWSNPDCTLCGQNDWRVEGRLFGLQRLMPAQAPTGHSLGAIQGVGRTVFPIVCMNCGHTYLVGSQVAGINESPVPDDLSGFTG